MISYVDLANQAVKYYLENHGIMQTPPNLSPDLFERRAGVFVTIYNKNASGQKELRGCIGTYMPQQKSIAEEIIHNAVAAASQDYRFTPLSKADLLKITVEVSILERPEPVSKLEDLDPKKYGIIVQTPDGRCGLLLPDLEGVSDIKQQVLIACQKGNINPDRDQLILQRFITDKYV